MGQEGKTRGGAQNYFFPSLNPQNGGIYDEFYVTMYGEQTRYIHFVGNCMGAKMCLVVQIFLLSGGKSVFSMSYYKVLEI
jgi:hypothetical protein